MKLTLRYLLVFLVAAAGSLLALLPLSMILHFALASVADRNAIGDALTPFIMGLAFVWAGARVAPESKFKAAVVLFGIVTAAVILRALIMAMDGSPLGSGSLLAILGALAPLEFFRRRSVKQLGGRESA